MSISSCSPDAGSRAEHLRVVQPRTGISYCHGIPLVGQHPYGQLVQTLGVEDLCMSSTNESYQERVRNMQLCATNMNNAIKYRE